MKAKFFLLLLGLSASTHTAWAQDYEDGEPEIPEGTCVTRHHGTCSEGFREIYRDVNRNRKTEIVCCTSGSQAEKQTAGDAENCRVTPCVPSRVMSACIVLPTRTINGTQQVYEEAMRDTCSIHNGKSYVAGLCCRKNSREGVLLTAMGAEPHEFPHQVKLKLPGHCGGTIYNKRWIITASHCITEADGSMTPADGMQVIAGSNMADIASHKYVYHVKRAIRHEQYSDSTGHPEREKPVDERQTYNDIALLELDRDIVFGPNVKSLELAPHNFEASEYADKAVIVGWGTTEILQLSINLHKANFVIRHHCWKQYYPTVSPKELKFLEQSTMCVGGISRDKYSLTAGGGDSGGAAICRGPQGYPVQCGVTSFGGSDEKCAQFQDEENCTPSIYTNAAYFRRWVERHAGKQDPSTFHRPYLYGRRVAPDEYPHQVSVTSTEGRHCGGTLIAPDVVLTAGQCISNGRGKMYSNLRVRGSTGAAEVVNTKLLTGFRMTGQPASEVKQGNRQIITDNYYVSDMALLKLGEPLIDDGMVAALPSNTKQLFEAGTELAFPRKSNNNKVGSGLMAREFTVLDRNECQRRMNRLSVLGLNLKMNEAILCGVEKYSGGSTCDRSLGGGLICPGEDGGDVVCGVQIFRLCEFTMPNSFTNVAGFSDWIKREMNNL